MKPAPEGEKWGQREPTPKTQLPLGTTEPLGDNRAFGLCVSPGCLAPTGSSCGTPPRSPLGIPTSLGTGWGKNPHGLASPGGCDPCGPLHQAPTLGSRVGHAGGACVRGCAAPRAGGRARGGGAGSQPRCYSAHSRSDSQAWIMNASEDFDVRVEIYQQIQWGRNIKCEAMPATYQRY